MCSLGSVNVQGCAVNTLGWFSLSDVWWLDREACVLDVRRSSFTVLVWFYINKQNMLYTEPVCSKSFSWCHCHLLSSLDSSTTSGQIKLNGMARLKFSSWKIATKNGGRSLHCKWNANTIHTYWSMAYTEKQQQFSNIFECATEYLPYRIGRPGLTVERKTVDSPEQAQQTTSW